MSDDSSKIDAWMPLLVERYKRDTEHLTTEQHGAYLLLLMTGWTRGGLLPDNDAQLSNIARLTPQRWRAHRAVLRSFFQSNGDGQLVQKRLLIEVERAQHLSIVRSAAGQESGRRRRKPPNKTGTSVPTNDEQMHQQTTQQTANKTAAIGATFVEQKGDYRGSPIPPSAPSDEPHTDTNTEDSVRCLPRAQTHAGEACRAMREAGMADVNPASPTLTTMLQQGITLAELADAARAAVAQGKGFAWALSRAAGQRADAARVALAPAVAKRASAFALPAGHVRVLPDDLPDLEMHDDEPNRGTA